jgi:hypothetical protein
MATLNNFGNCSDDLIGTGSRTCDLKSYGDPVGIGLPKKGVTWTVANFTGANWKEDIKNLDLFPFIGLYNFEQNTPENDTATSNTGVMVEIRAGKPQLSFMFTRGGGLHKALYDKRGHDRWDLVLLFEKGVLFASNVDKSILKGFDMGMFSVATLAFVQGTDPQMSTAILQLKDAEEFNARHQFITYEQLGVNLSKVDGVVETQITYVSEPDDSDEIELRVVNACSTGDVILDLDDVTSWGLGGTQAGATTIASVDFDADAQTYTLNLSAALADGDTVRPFLRTGSLRVAEDTLGNLFKGQAPLATVEVPSL